MITYVLTISQFFQAYHKRAGEKTHFAEKVLSGKKIHTICESYDVWAKRFEKINSREACLSIRYWSGKPYRSKQVEVLTLDNNNGIGLEKLFYSDYTTDFVPFVGNRVINDVVLANNDGLSFDDFKDWFKKADKTKPLAIIHFTNFRYGK